MSDLRVQCKVIRTLLEPHRTSTLLFPLLLVSLLPPVSSSQRPLFAWYVSQQVLSWFYFHEQDFREGLSGPEFCLRTFLRDRLTV